MAQQPKKLLDQVRDAIRFKHYGYSTEKTYVYWARQFVLYHNRRRPHNWTDVAISDMILNRPGSSCHQVAPLAKRSLS